MDRLEKPALRPLKVYAFDPRVVRSDSLPVAGAPSVAMTRLPLGFAKGDLWYDYFIPLG